LAIGCHDLGMSEREFWRSTPLQFDWRLKRFLAHEQREDYRTGILAALISNSTPSTKKRKPAQPDDFFASLKKKRGQAPDSFGE